MHPIHPVMTIIETSRLTISELTTADAPFIIELLNSPGWLQYIGDRGVKTIDDACGYILNGPTISYRTNGFGLWVVALKDTNIPIGICGLIRRDFLPHPDIGFAFLPQYSGSGYALESAKGVMDFAANVLRLPVVTAITNDDNTSSLKLLFKLGFDFIGMVTYPGEDKELMLLEKHITIR